MFRFLYISEISIHDYDLRPIGNVILGMRTGEPRVEAEGVEANRRVRDER